MFLLRRQIAARSEKYRRKNGYRNFLANIRGLDPLHPILRVPQ
jgi:hypothetical protein